MTVLRNYNVTYYLLIKNHGNCWPLGIYKVHSKDEKADTILLKMEVAAKMHTNFISKVIISCVIKTIKEQPKLKHILFSVWFDLGCSLVLIL